MKQATPEMFSDLEKGRQAIDQGLERLTDLFMPHVRAVLGPAIEEAMREPLPEEERANLTRGLAMLAVVAERTPDPDEAAAEKEFERLSDAFDANLTKGAALEPELDQAIQGHEAALRPVIDAGLSDEDIRTEIEEETRRTARSCVVQWFHLLRENASNGILDTRTLDGAMLPTAADPDGVGEFLANFPDPFTPESARAVFENVRGGLPDGQHLPDEIVLALELHDVTVAP